MWCRKGYILLKPKGLGSHATTHAVWVATGILAVKGQLKMPVYGELLFAKQFLRA
jgi:hypothetical protein